jgi:hypothetical protein
MLTSTEIRRRVSGTFAILLGVFFWIEGVWGLFSPVVFGVFTTNIPHAVLHIVLGVAGIGLGWRGPARTYLCLAGLLLVIVGLLRFISATAWWVVEFLNVNIPVARLNIVLGSIALLLFFVSGRGERERGPVL